MPINDPISSDKKKVVVVGGGIAGLTVAHELSKSPQYAITVYEQNRVFGGKARSVRIDGKPGEHAMRVYLASYNALYHIMQEIPLNGSGKTAYDNLAYPTFTFRFGKESYTLSAKYTGLWKKLKESYSIFRFVNRSGVPFHEILYFIYKVGRLLWLSPGRIERELSNISFESYMGGPDRTKAFNDIVLRISEMLVAAKRTASARVVARVLLEWYIGPFLKSKFSRLGFSALNGPTSEYFIDPWVASLKAKKNVKLLNNHRVTHIEHAARTIQHMDIQGPNGPRQIHADYFVFAVQHNILDAFLGDDLRRVLPELGDLRPLGEEWSTGVQFFLKKIPEAWQRQAGRITIAIESPWSLVFMINQPGDSVWSDTVSMPADCVAVLTLVASNSKNPGLIHNKPLVTCTKKEFLEECFHQLRLPEQPNLENIILGGIDGGYIGPDLKYVPKDDFIRLEKGIFAGFAAAYIPASQEVMVSDSLLYVRRPGNLQIEPENTTSIGNFYVTGEFTRTHFSTPTMEKSCESGMRCAKTIFLNCGLHDFAQVLEPRIRGVELPLAFLKTVRFRIALIAVILIVLIFFFIQG